LAGSLGISSTRVNERTCTERRMLNLRSEWRLSSHLKTDTIPTRVLSLNHLPHAASVKMLTKQKMASPAMKVPLLMVSEREKEPLDRSPFLASFANSER